MRGVLLLFTAVLVLLTAGPAAARTVDLGPASATVDANENPECTVGLDNELCAAIVRINDSTRPGEWGIWFNKTIREVSISVEESPAGEPIHESFSPDQIVVEHPLFPTANDSWKALDAALPDGAREYARLESADFPDASPYDDVDDSTWGIRITVYPPGGEPQSFWVLCWDLSCQRIWWGMFRSEEEGIQFESSAISNPGGWDNHGWLEDFFTHPNGALGCNSIWRDSGCPEEALSLAREGTTLMVGVANDNTPNVHTFYEVDEAGVNVGPSQRPLDRTRDGANNPVLRHSSPSAPTLVSRLTVPSPMVDPDGATLPPSSASPGIASKGPDASVRPARSLTSSSSLPGVSHAVVVAALATCAALLAGLVALFTRLRRERVLDHSLRRLVYESICKEPGVRVGTLAARLGVHYRTVQHHVDALAEFSLVKVHERRLLPAGLLSPADEQRCMGVLANSTAREVHELLLARGPLDLAQIAQAIGASYSTASAVAVRLRKGGLAQREREWRRWVFRAIPANASTPRARAAAALPQTSIRADG